jgi:FtsP/CotA-like multicopper oxidase with cupredoxin domain
LPNATTVHWHGLVLPIEQDGVPELSQAPIPPGDEHVYEFDIPDTPGTYFYHTHFSADRQQPLGLYGALIIDDPEPPSDVASEHVIALGEWTVIGSETYPAMQLEGMLPNYFTFNGKSYPATGEGRPPHPVSPDRHRPVHPPDPNPRRTVRDRGDRRQPGARRRSPHQGHRADRPGRAL